ncbi:SdpI/YhfL protein family protein [Aeromicrobium choanae]|uniref:SdpI/YhfL protein family protein n=2 Tax=Aeromicrobium choanae TaxID=1736691 RepID=A0A1T4YS71_9ACTN|nr:SdpI/YhfL protein family protein [Aeromicrobium choanae]
MLGRAVVGLVMLGVAALLWWMARAAAAGRLERNALVGIRTPSTMASDEAWLAAHQRAERPTKAAAITSAAVAAACLLPMPEAALITVVLGGCAAILGLAIHAAVVGGRAARATSAD